MHSHPPLPTPFYLIIVPTHFSGGGGGGGGEEELYTQLFFLFSQFSPIDIFIVQDFEWYH